MSATPFDVAAEELERLSALDTLEARGTLRIVLKEAGLDPKTTRVLDLLIVIEKLLPNALASRGVENSTSLCGALCSALKSRSGELAGRTAVTPADILRRIRAK
jgi:hypothetical protein